MGVFMKFLKIFGFSFLLVFFANYLLPDITVMLPTKIPHLGGEIPFAAGLAFLNTLIYPIFRQSYLRLGIAAVILNFIAYGALRFLPIGIEILNFKGYLIASAVVAVGNIVILFVQKKYEVPNFNSTL